MPAHPHPTSRFARIAAWCYGHRKTTFFAWAVALVLVWVVGSAVGTKEISSVRLPDTESQRAYDLLEDHFPARNGDTDQLVFKARSGEVQAQRAAIGRALDEVRRVGGVQEVADPFAAGGQVSRDGRIAVAEVTYKGSADDQSDEDLEAVQDRAFAARSGTLQVEHGGLGAQIVRYNSQQDPSEMIGILAAAVVLVITFGSLVAAGMTLLTALLALGTTLGTIAFISQVVDTPDFAAQLASLIGLGVGIDYALFVVTRYRAEVAAGRDRAEAVVVAIDTAGRTVFFAALTVVIALLGLLLLGLSFMNGVAVACALAVLLTMTAALTLLPAFLGGAGGWVDRLRLPSLRPSRRGAAGAALRAEREGRNWERWSRVVQRRPLIAALLSGGLLLGLAVPALGMRLGTADAGVDPEGSTTKAAYELIAEGFGPGVNGSFLLAVDLPRKGDDGAAQRVRDTVAQDDDLIAVGRPLLSPDGEVATITAYPRTGPQDARTTDVLERLREDVLPGAEQATGATVEVGGLVASQEDFTKVVADKLPLFVGAVVLLSALLLLAVFRSLLIPLKAALMNLLSIGASLGVVTLVFQEGLLADELGIGTGPIESFLPVMLFAIVFGLSMDYEVFLVSRVHEEWERTRDAAGSVARGLATTGRVITAAASIMIVVFAAFVLGDDRIIKLFGIGLASAIFLDAVVIRCVLVPAIMELMGERAWWLPKAIDRAVPRLALERPADEVAERPKAVA